MSVKNIFREKVGTTELDIKTNIPNNIIDIQADKIENTTTIEMKLSSIISNQYSSYYQTPTD